MAMVDADTIVLRVCRRKNKACTWQDVADKHVKKTESLLFIFYHQQQQPSYEV